MRNADRVLEIAKEIGPLRERLSALQKELDSLVVPDKRGVGRPPSTAGESVSGQIERALSEADGPLATNELPGKGVKASRRNINAALSYLLKRGRIERTEKGVYRLKK